MLIDIFEKIGDFASENCVLGMIIALIFLALALVAQVIINGSLEEDLVELTERLEAVEKKCGIMVYAEQTLEEDEREDTKTNEKSKDLKED